MGASLSATLPRLTSARFIAAMAVLMYHAGVYLHLAHGPLAVTRLGFLGVPFFFLLSGFVLMWSRPVRARRAAFYRARFARIWPLHALGLIVAIWLCRVEGVYHGPASVVPNVLLVQAWIPAPQIYYGLNVVAWSLSCEAFFYVLFPFLAPAIGRCSPPTLLRVGAAFFGCEVVGFAAAHYAIGGQAATWLLTVFPPARLGEFLAGAALASAMQQGWRPPRERVLIAIAASTVLGLALTSRWVSLDSHPYVADMLFLPLVLLLVPALAARDLAGREGVMTTRLMLALGEASFALYVIHHLLLRAQMDVFGTTTFRLAVPLLLVDVITSVSLALAITRWFERPVRMRILRRPRTPAVLVGAEATDLAPRGSATPSQYLVRAVDGDGAESPA